MLQSDMHKPRLLGNPKFGRARLMNRPLPDKPSRVDPAQAAPLSRGGLDVGKAVGAAWEIVAFVAPVAAIFAIAGHDVVIAGAYNLAGCRIKGNVSHHSSDRIFHVPGQTDYGATRVTFLRGERWFCTEQQAHAAGWRKAGK